MRKSIKIIANSLLIVSALGSNSIIANAEWKKDNTGWWYKEENSWSVGWRLLDGKWYYFGEDGYMKTGWLKDNNGKWYYLNSDGSMAHDTTIDGFILNSDGSWNEQSKTSSVTKKLTNINSNATNISDVTGINFDDITKIIFYDGRGANSPVTVEDKQKIKEFMGYLNNYSISVEKSEDHEDKSGWIHNALFYINDKNVINITFTDPIEINGEYFNVTKGNLSTRKIEEFLKSIDPSYNVMTGLV